MFNLCNNLIHRCLNNQIKLLTLVKLSGMSVSSQDKIDVTGNSELTKCFSESGVKQIIRIFKESNYPLRLCGGAVRDILSGKKPKDLDFATTATPDQMEAMYNANNVRIIAGESGKKHGTITCRIDEENYEVTTLRIDTVNNGRHATVNYTQDWELDAERRDLTINSMYVDLQSGDIFDFFNGRKHLEEKKVIFVKDPAVRINEDYLRILRYFRFYARIADTSSSHDDETIAAIKNNGEGLKNISGERIWTELKLILNSSTKADLNNYSMVKNVIVEMVNCRVLSHIGFPENIKTEHFCDLCDKLKVYWNPHPMVFIASLLNDESEIPVLRKVLKFSNIEKSVLEFILRNRNSIKFSPCSDITEQCKDLLVDTFRKDKHSLMSFFELMKYLGNVELIDKFKAYEIPTMPLNGKDVKTIIGKKGPIIGKYLNDLFEVWKQSRYTLKKDDLVKILQEF